MPILKICMTSVILLCLSSAAAATEDAIENTATTNQESPVPQQDAQEKNTPDQDRGQILYENHCRTCHESNVHIRNKRRAQSIDDIRSWVMRWSSELKLQWKTEDVEAVVNYLNSQFYKFKKSTELE
jgi:cytochrome c5